MRHPGGQRLSPRALPCRFHLREGAGEVPSSSTPQSCRVELDLSLGSSKTCIFLPVKISAVLRYPQPIPSSPAPGGFELVSGPLRFLCGPGHACATLCASSTPFGSVPCLS